jgi:hypothetical protein
MTYKEAQHLSDLELIAAARFSAPLRTASEQFAIGLALANRYERLLSEHQQAAERLNAKLTEAPCSS